MQQYIWWRHKFWDLQVSQKHKNLDISRTKYHFFFKQKNSLLHIKRCFMTNNSFVGEVNFNQAVAS